MVEDPEREVRLRVSVIEKLGLGLHGSDGPRPNL